MTWHVELTKKATKQARMLDRRVFTALQLLIENLEQEGPTQPSWLNYGKLRLGKNWDCRHCHLVKGNPTYVCCWEIIDSEQKMIEVYYVGTHENAPY
jgi:mRNA-degrading endonuclease RelE of RelBE toxin-antitoxin system